MFATGILKLPELPPDLKDGRIYDLNPLCSKGFDFVYDAGNGVQDVAVKKLRLSSKVKKGDRITLEADAIHNPDLRVAGEDHRLLFAQVRRAGPATARHLECLRDLTEGTGGSCRGMTPQAALIEFPWYPTNKAANTTCSKPAYNTIVNWRAWENETGNHHVVVISM
jgi:hypothetical protein